MALRLSSDEQGWSIPLGIDSSVASLLNQQKAHADEAGRNQLFIELISREFLAALKGVLGTDLRLPTNTQIDLAVLIARELGIPIPGEALRYRGAMEQFLSSHRRAYSYASNERDIQAKAWESHP